MGAHSRTARLVLLHDPFGRPSGFPDWPGSKGIVFRMLFTAEPDRVQAAINSDYLIPIPTEKYQRLGVAAQNT